MVADSGRLAETLKGRINARMIARIRIRLNFIAYTPAIRQDGMIAFIGLTIYQEPHSGNLVIALFFSRNGARFVPEPDGQRKKPLRYTTGHAHRQSPNDHHQWGLATDLC
jgi:hypothetical protein